MSGGVAGTDNPSSHPVPPAPAPSPSTPERPTGSTAVDGPASRDAESVRQGHPTLVYTALRVLLLAATLGVVWLLGARGWLWLALGFVISGLLSLILLTHQRDAMSMGVAGVFGRINARIEASTRAEDDDPADDVAPVSGAGDRAADDVAPTAGAGDRAADDVAPVSGAGGDDAPSGGGTRPA